MQLNGVLNKFLNLYRYLPYDPNPLKLKVKTDKSLALLAEIKEKTVNVNELKPREMKTFEQVSINYYRINNFVQG